MSERVTVPIVQASKVRAGELGGEAGAPSHLGKPLVMVTAYDTPTARMADQAGIDIILVGDSVAMVVLGHPDTLQVGVDEMVHHTAAVARARPRALVVADLPWLSYHLEPVDTVRNAARLVRAGAQAVKLEGGRRRVPAVRSLVDAEIPVMGHLGLTPQSVHVMGGYRVQAKETDAALELVDHAMALAEAGCFALVIEGVPAATARMVTEAVPIPTIGIGAGAWCDGQVLVLHDLLGLHDQVPAKFVRRYANLMEEGVSALSRFADDVRAARFPTEDESYSLPRRPETSADSPERG